MIHIRPARIPLIAAMTALLMLPAACGGSNPSGSPSPAPSGGSPAAGGGSPAAGGGTPRNIVVTATNFAFDPTDIQLHVGDTVQITLQNKDGVHGLAIPDLGVDLRNGQTAKFTVDKEGRYDFYCAVQCGTGHDNMTGTINVSP